MTDACRPKVCLVADGDERAMLSEWLLAAGFDAVDAASADRSQAPVCSLVRWPAQVTLGALPSPVLALYEPGAELQAVVGQVQDVVELPDSQNVSSLLAWSKRLNELLRGAVEQKQRERAAAAATPTPAPKQLDEAPVQHRSAAPAAVAAAPSGRCVDGPELIAVGISTGGPGSLRELFEQLPKDRSLPPIVVVQHIPPGFVDDLVERLRTQTGYDVRFAADGEPLQQGVAYIAPGDQHLHVVRRPQGLCARWSDAPPIRGHKPAADELFASCARLHTHGVAVIMTGMGKDGALPMRALRDLGWETLGQDEATCTIYGMPRAAYEAGAVRRQLPLDRIAPWLEAYCKRSTAGAT